MAVMSAMMAIIVPRLRVSPNQYVRIAARQLMKDAEVARNRSLSMKRITRLQFDSGTNTYLTYVDDDNDGVIANTPAEAIAAIAFGTRVLQNGVILGRGAAPNVPGEVGAGAVTFTSERVEFDTRGLPTPFGTKGTIYLRAQNDANIVYAVQLSAAGSYRLWRYFQGTWQ
jgi:hypothetical protein